MWMDAYVEEILLRQRIAEVQRRAEIDHLLRGCPDGCCEKRSTSTDTSLQNDRSV